MTASGFGIDIGGSGVKGAPVDLQLGTTTADRFRIPTPQTDALDVLATIPSIVQFFRWQGPVGVTVPGVVRDGVVRDAVNMPGNWCDLNVRAVVADAIGTSVTVRNDADAAGLAEARYGAGRDVDGLVLVLTFGTGIGSALIVDGQLVPNTEFGHLEFKGMEAEHYAAARLHEHEGMPLREWATRADEVIRHFDFIFSPQLIVIGGGISKQFDQFQRHLTTSTPVVPAVLRNEAGIVGAAMSSREEPAQ